MTGGLCGGESGGHAVVEHGTRGGPDQSAENVETPDVWSSRNWSTTAARATSDMIPMYAVWLVGVDPLNITQSGQEPALPWNQRQLCRGIGGKLGMESVAALPWNGWQPWRGISGRIPLESVAAFAWNTQS